MSAYPLRIEHVSYIAATPARTWDALTNPEVTQRYWYGTRIESDWRVGSKILYVIDGKVTDEHVVLAVEPLRRLVHAFHPVFGPYEVEPPSRVTFTLEAGGDVVRLTMLHDDLPRDSAVYTACRGAWPMILSNLKTLLETGRPLPSFDAR